MAHDVFLSYSSKDKPAADVACAMLERVGVRVWMAPRDLLPGMGWASSIVSAISNSQVLVLIFSSNANMSSQVEREVERAINKGITILPFRLEATPPSAALEYFLSTPHWLDGFPPPIEGHLEVLIKTVRQLLDIKPAKQLKERENN